MAFIVPRRQGRTALMLESAISTVRAGFAIGLACGSHERAIALRDILRARCPDADWEVHPRTVRQPDIYADGVLLMVGGDVDLPGDMVSGAPMEAGHA